MANDFRHLLQAPMPNNTEALRASAIVRCVLWKYTSVQQLLSLVWWTGWRHRQASLVATWRFFVTCEQSEDKDLQLVWSEEPKQLIWFGFLAAKVDRATCQSCNICYVELGSFTVLHRNNISSNSFHENMSFMSYTLPLLPRALAEHRI